MHWEGSSESWSYIHIESTIASPGPRRERLYTWAVGDTVSGAGLAINRPAGDFVRCIRGDNPASGVAEAVPLQSLNRPLSMGYRNLAECVKDLERTGQLIRFSEPVDPVLEAAEIQRRVCQAAGPAILFERVKGSSFPLLGNLFGTLDRARFLFRDTEVALQRLFKLSADPMQAATRPWKHLKELRLAWCMRPKMVRRAAVLEHETTIDALPKLVCWPQDGGPFLTLPMVYTEHPDRSGWRHSNLGMYRIQLSGNQYKLNAEVGLHYQIHRGIGIHHAAAIERNERLKVQVFVGGPPAMMIAAVMPLPETIPELSFAGALGGFRIPLCGTSGELPVLAEADFCISGYVEGRRLLPEGPFGDHLGYYAKVHDFPVLNVQRVSHRKGAIMPFTVVGRPPQEDTVFGQLIHEWTGPLIPQVVRGVKEVHAVDAAGVHPLLLAIGSERYTPYEKLDKPQELLTQANAILGQGQLSLAKYLLIVNHADRPDLDVHDVGAFIQHVLERVDWRRDLHFQTRTTMDTLDYTGSALNAGSKVVIAAAGPKVRELPRDVPPGIAPPLGLARPRIALPGVLVMEPERQTPFDAQLVGHAALSLSFRNPWSEFPLIVVADDSQQATQSLRDFLWITFTRSDPAADIHGADAAVEQKHWGCALPLLIDARRKPHHAPPLESDPSVSKKVDQWVAPGGPLHGIIS